MKRIIRAALTAALLATASGTLILPQAAYADGPKLTQSVAKPLTEAQAALKNNDPQTALAKVKEAQAASDLTSYDQLVINEFLAQIYIDLKDYPNAATAVVAVADSPDLPDDQKQQFYHNAVLLLVPQKQFQKAIEYGQKLAAMNALDPTIEAMLAEAYYFSNDFVNAQKYAQMSIDGSKAAGQPPSQNALQIIMSSQAKQNNTAGAEETLENLALNYNRAEDWSKVIDLALSGKNVKDADALYLLRLKMLIPDAMEKEDYTSLGSVANQQGYPTEALHALQQGISSGKITAAQAGPLLATARRGAETDERSLSQIAAAAAKARTGEQDIKLGEDYWGYSRFADAQTAAQQAEAKDSLKDPSEGPMLVGMLDVAQGKFNDATQVLAQVHGSAAREKTAHIWSLYAQAQVKAQTGTAAQAPATAPAPQH